MPIKSENAARYPKNWRQIRAAILERAGDKCEECGVPNHAYRNRTTGEWTTNEMQVETWSCVDGDQVTLIVLTIAHLDHTPENCAASNLKALCQRDHLRYDQGHHAQSAYRSRRKGKAVDMFEGST